MQEDIYDHESSKREREQVDEEQSYNITYKPSFK